MKVAHGAGEVYGCTALIPQAMHECAGVRWESNNDLQPDRIRDAFVTRENTMDFSEALGWLKNGHKVARTGWNGKNQFLYLVPGSTFNVNRKPLLGIYPEGTEIQYRAHIDIRTVDGSCVPWIASQVDLLANDWAIV